LLLPKQLGSRRCSPASCAAANRTVIPRTQETLHIRGRCFTHAEHASAPNSRNNRTETGRFYVGDRRTSLLCLDKRPIRACFRIFRNDKLRETAFCGLFSPNYAAGRRVSTPDVHVRQAEYRRANM
jgi:hypothetical protein